MNEAYHQQVKAIFEKVFATQSANIIKACEIGYESIKNNKRFYVLGTGHSHMMAEEFFARLKGTDLFTPIILPEFMLHQFPGKSTMIERLAPYADVVYGMYPIKEGDTIMLVSNSGRNGLLVELALRAKENKANLITCVNHEQAKVITSRHISGKNIIHFADVIIDNCGAFGDACYELTDGVMTGSTSNMVTLLIAQMMNAVMINLSNNSKLSNEAVLDQFKTYFFNCFNRTLTQTANVKAAAELVYEAVKNENHFFVYGGGHSHLITEEFYSRAGGLACISAILEDEIMVHMSADKSNLVEQSVEYANVLMQKYGIKENDVLLIASNSGKGKLTVELALLAKKANAKVIALTNARQAAVTQSKHLSGKLLADVADVIIDNCAEVNDAALVVADQVCCPLSSSLGCYLAQSLVVDICYEMMDHNMMPPVLLSANIEEAQTEHQKYIKAKSEEAKKKYRSYYLSQGPRVF